MKASMIHNNGVSFLMLLAAGVILFEASSTSAAPHLPRFYPGYYSPFSMESQNPEYLLQTIAKLRQALIADDDLENAIISKRNGLDFGTGRGYSGERQNKQQGDLDKANIVG